jgi:hypothetical protein
MPAAPYTAPGKARPKKTPARFRKAVGDAMKAIASEAAALPDSYVRSLAPILRQAQAETAAAFKNWLANVPDGNERFTAQRYRQALLQLSVAIETVEKRVGGKHGAMAGTLIAQGAGAGAMAISHLQQEVAAFAAVFGASVRPLQLNQAAIMAKGDNFLIPRYRNSAARYGQDMGDDIRRQLAIGLASGETFAEMTNRLVGLRGPTGMVSLRGLQGSPSAYHEHIAEGLFVRYRYWAERIVRTEGLNAYNTHHLHALAEAEAVDPGYQKRWDATWDGVCPICKDLDGVIVDIDKPFPGGYAHPPAHPNDKCALTPWRAEWNEGYVPPPVEEVEDEAPVDAGPTPEEVAAQQAEAKRQRDAQLAEERRQRDEREAAARKKAEPVRKLNQYGHEVMSAAQYLSAADVPEEFREKASEHRRHFMSRLPPHAKPYRIISGAFGGESMASSSVARIEKELVLSREHARREGLKVEPRIVEIELDADAAAKALAATEAKKKAAEERKAKAEQLERERAAAKAKAEAERKKADDEKLERMRAAAEAEAAKRKAEQDAQRAELERRKQERSAQAAAKPKGARAAIAADLARDVEVKKTEAYVSGKLRGRAVSVPGGFRVEWYDTEGNAHRVGPGVFADRDGAMAALRQRVDDDLLEMAQLTAEKFDLQAVTDAMVKGDKEAVRAQVRAAIRQAGAMSRDPTKFGRNAAQIVDDPKVVPDHAEATHGWTGIVNVGPGKLRGYGEEIDRKVNPKTDLDRLVVGGPPQGLHAMIHEELHGATPFIAPDFYRGAGAGLEEVTVEMAARKVNWMATRHVTGAKDFKMFFGSYKREIDAVSKILIEEAKADADAVHDVIASAGIAMRAPGAAVRLGRYVETEDDLIDLFLHQLPYDPGVKLRIGNRIRKDLRKLEANPGGH